MGSRPTRWTRLLGRYGERVRRADLAVGGHDALVADVDLVELRDVVVGDAERLLHHHRRGRPVLLARLVAVAERVADLVVDGVLPVGRDVVAERLRAAQPAGG